MAEINHGCDTAVGEATTAPVSTFSFELPNCSLGPHFPHHGAAIVHHLLVEVPLFFFQSAPALHFL